MPKDLIDELRDGCEGDCITSSSSAKGICNTCQKIIRETDEASIMDLFIVYNDKIDKFSLADLVMIMSESDKINFIFSLLSAFDEHGLMMIEDDVRTSFKDMYFEITNAILKIREGNN